MAEVQVVIHVDGQRVGPIGWNANKSFRFPNSAEDGKKPSLVIAVSCCTRGRFLNSRLNAEMGKTIIMVSHDGHAVQSARHVTHLEKGELLPG